MTAACPSAPSSARRYWASGHALPHGRRWLPEFSQSAWEPCGRGIGVCDREIAGAGPPTWAPLAAGQAQAAVPPPIIRHGSRLRQSPGGSHPIATTQAPPDRRGLQPTGRCPILGLARKPASRAGCCNRWYLSSVMPHDMSQQLVRRSDLRANPITAPPPARCLNSFLLPSVEMHDDSSGNAHR